MMKKIILASGFVFVFGITNFAFATTAITDSYYSSSTAIAGHSANYEIGFQTPLGTSVSGDIVVVAMPQNFDVSVITMDDVDLSIDPTCTGSYSNVDLAATASGSVWGYSYDTWHSSFVFTQDTDIVDPDSCIKVLIGQNASHQASGVHQIINPAVPGNYDIGVATLGVLDSSGLVSVPIVSNRPQVIKGKPLQAPAPTLSPVIHRN
jgi:hypothetical protein